MSTDRTARRVLIPVYHLVVMAVPLIALGNFANAVTYLLDGADDAWWRVPFNLVLAVWLAFWFWPTKRAELREMEAAQAKGKSGGAA